MNASTLSPIGDRPIPFGEPTIAALLREARRSGTGKTQHRVPLKLPTKGQYIHPKMGGWEPCTNGGGGCFRFGRGGERIPVPETIGIWHQTTGYCMDAPYQVGMRLWVREAFATGRADHLWGPTVYKATHIAMAPVCEGFSPWRSASQMPRDRSRLTLLVTEVRVERLNDISEADARAEGCHAFGPDIADLYSHSYGGADDDFRELWNSLHGPDAWLANPWVVAVTFRPILANIDALPAVTTESDRG